MLVYHRQLFSFGTIYVRDTNNGHFPRVVFWNIMLDYPTWQLKSNWKFHFWSFDRVLRIIRISCRLSKVGSLFLEYTSPWSKQAKQIWSHVDATLCCFEKKRTIVPRITRLLVKNKLDFEIFYSTKSSKTINLISR